jgi:hypothetical protein
MDAQQELFTALLTQLKAMYKDETVGVYDTVLPDLDTPYPFVYLADSQLVDDYGNKSMIFGTITQTIDVWSDNPKKRGTLSAIMNEVKLLCRALTTSPNYYFTVTNISQRITSDTTTGTTLMRGTLDIDFKIIGGK